MGSMRWFHEGVDRLHVAVTSRLVPPVFRHGIDSPPLCQHLAAVRLNLPPLTQARRYAVSVNTLVGDLEAGVQIRPGARPDLPVVVYHHGIAEMPADKSFRGIFRARTPIQAHLVAIRAPFHRSWLHLLPGLATLSRFVALCAVSLRLMEAVRRHFMAAGARASLLVGTSLGGFLTLLHALTYGTAQAYVPLLAGPDLAHVMLATHYRRYLAPAALEHPERLAARLDFRAAFQASQPRNVFPLLARYDLAMLYAHHRACYAACQVPVVTIERGHLTGALAFSALRSHVRHCLDVANAPAP